METSMIYSLWKLVDQMHCNELIYLGDGELIDLLTEKLMTGRQFNEWDAEKVQSYISDRIPLIRELSKGGF